MAKIFIGTPMYGGMCTAHYTNSLLSLQLELYRHGHEPLVHIIQNESLITRARNIIADDFLSTDYDYLLFIDSDHNFNALDIIKMIDCDLDILCAIPPKKSINWNNAKKAIESGYENIDLFSGDFVINTDSEVEIYADKPFEISAGGTGLMLIKRGVFEKMEKTLPKYISNRTNEDIVNKKKVTEFFSTSIYKDILLSEDYNFCKTWRDLGGKVYAAPWVGITHIGQHEFNGSFLGYLQIINNL